MHHIAHLMHRCRSHAHPVRPRIAARGRLKCDISALCFQLDIFCALHLHALLAVQYNLCLFPAFSVELTPVSNQMQRLFTKLYHPVLRRQHLILISAKIRIVTGMPAPKTHHPLTGIHLIIDLHHIPCIRHTVKVIADRICIWNPPGLISRRPKINLHICSVHRQHFSPQNPGLTGCFHGLPCRRQKTFLIDKCDLILQKTLFAGNMAFYNDHIPPIKTHGIAGANCQITDHQNRLLMFKHRRARHRVSLYTANPVHIPPHTADQHFSRFFFRKRHRAGVNLAAGRLTVDKEQSFLPVRKSAPELPVCLPILKKHLRNLLVLIQLKQSVLPDSGGKHFRKHLIRPLI